MKTTTFLILALVMLRSIAFGQPESIIVLTLKRDAKTGEKLNEMMLYNATWGSDAGLKGNDLIKNLVKEESLQDFLGKPFIRDAKAHNPLHIGMFEKGEYPELDEKPDGVLVAGEPKIKQLDEEIPRELSEVFISPITFKFLDEEGNPMRGDFTLHQYKKGKFFKNWFRYLPLDKNGEITIKEFPPEFQFGGSSIDKFYFYWLHMNDLDPAKKTFVHRAKPSGAMKFEITKYPRKYYDSLVVEFHKKVLGNFHRQVKGIGIHPDDSEHIIGDLRTGEYFIAIKFDYEDQKPIFRSKPFTVKLKEYTVLPKIEITEDAILEAKANK